MSGFNVETTGDQVVEALGQHGKGKTIVITGPSADSVGAEIAETLAKTKPKLLLLLGRNEAKIIPVVDSIRKSSPDVKVDFIHCDLCANASVRRAAEQIVSRTNDTGVDVLINAAGVMAVRTYTPSQDGVETQFAANHLGHFLLTGLLAGPLKKAHGIVLNVTSSAYCLAEVDSQDVNFDKGQTYDPWVAYGRSKTANILFSHGIAQKYGDSNVTSFAVDPGMVKGTNLMGNSGVGPELMQKGMEMAVQRNDGKPLLPHPKVSRQQGCATAVLASLDHSLRAEAPAFLKECQVTPVLPYACDPVEVDKLWGLSEKLVGQQFSS